MVRCTYCSTSGLKSTKIAGALHLKISHRVAIIFVGKSIKFDMRGAAHRNIRFQQALKKTITPLPDTNFLTEYSLLGMNADDVNSTDKIYRKTPDKHHPEFFSSSLPAPKRLPN